MSRDGSGTLAPYGLARKEGEYYYAPHRSWWGIWQWHSFEVASGGHGEFIKDCRTKEEARREVYKLNKWSKD